MNKKIISAILAGACAVSMMSFSVSAATAVVPGGAVSASGNKDVTTTGSELKLSTAAVVAAPEIKVSVPSAIAAVVNPYGVAVTVKGVTYGSTGVTSPIYTIVNKTTASNIQVSASATMTLPTEKISVKVNAGDGSTPASKTITARTVEVKTADITTPAATGDKQIFAYVVAVAGTAAVNVVTPTQAAADSTGKAVANVTDRGVFSDSAFAATITASTLKYGTTGCVAFGDTTDCKIVTDKTKTDYTQAEFDALKSNTIADATEYKNLVVLPAATAATTEEMAADAALKAVGASKVTYAQFAIGGSVNATNNWTAADKVNLNLILKFAPTANAK